MEEKNITGSIKLEIQEIKKMEEKLETKEVKFSNIGTWKTIACC